MCTSNKASDFIFEFHWSLQEKDKKYQLIMVKFDFVRHARISFLSVIGQSSAIYYWMRPWNTKLQTYKYIKFRLNIFLLYHLNYFDIVV